MSELVMEMAPQCSIYDKGFSKLAEEHEIDVGYDMSKTVDHVLTGPY